MKTCLADDLYYILFHRFKKYAKSILISKYKMLNNMHLYYYMEILYAL